MQKMPYKQINTKVNSINKFSLIVGKFILHKYQIICPGFCMLSSPAEHTTHAMLWIN